MNECRNCGSRETTDLGYIGEVAPFFLKRVLNLEHGLAPTGHPAKRFLRKIDFLANIFQKIYGKSVLAEIEICPCCSFIQTKLPFPDEAIGRLYADYRSDSYNRERVRYEPEYAAIAPQAGRGIQEVRARTAGLTGWLKSKMKAEDNFSMLDYGGADGKFLPNFPGEKYVFDISDIPPVEGVTRIQNESKLGCYSYIQLAHVLEHVTYPGVLARKAASFLKDSGHLYIEVPQEISEETMARLAHGDNAIRLGIHEHINQYSPKSVTVLLQSSGLKLVAVETEAVDLGWIKATVVRALGRKL